MPGAAHSSYDALARIAAFTLDAPAAFIALCDGPRHSIRGTHGLAAYGSLEEDLCARVRRERELVVDLDERLVVGAPINVRDALRGVLVISAPWKKTPPPRQLEQLASLASLAGELIDKDTIAEERAEAAANAQRLNVLFDGIGEGIVVLAPDGSAAATNPAAERILQLDREQLNAERGGTDWRCIHEDGSNFPVKEHPAQASLRDGEDRSNVVIGIYRAHGELFWLSVNSRVIRGEDGNVQSVIATFHDITAIKEAQAAGDRLSRQEHLVTTGTLAAGVGHEINNPLAAILANLEYAIDEIRSISGGSPAGRLRELVTVLGESRDSVDRIRAIVRGLRSLARQEELPVPTDIEQTIHVAMNMAQHEIRHRATVALALTGVPAVLGDESRLTQVLVNLIMNAAQSFKTSDVASNRIRIATRLVGPNVLVDVEDNGPGVPPELARRIFDPFFTTKPIGQGTGLGLSISRSIVSDLGGELSVEPTPGGGATFHLSFPASARRPQSEAPRSLDPRSTRGRVLVVDDDPAVLGALRRALEREHEVIACGDPREAAGLIESGERYDVVFCDLMMPTLNGDALHARAVSKDRQLADRFVFITGGATRPALNDFLASVPNERLEKPFSIQNIRGIARRFVASRRS